MIGKEFIRLTAEGIIYSTSNHQQKQKKDTMRTMDSGVCIERERKEGNKQSVAQREWVDWLTDWFRHAIHTNCTSNERQKNSTTRGKMKMKRKRKRKRKLEEKIIRWEFRRAEEEWKERESEERESEREKESAKRKERMAMVFRVRVWRSSSLFGVA